MERTRPPESNPVRPRSGVVSGLTLLLPLALLAGLLVVRPVLTPAPAFAGAATQDPVALKAAAADKLEATTAKGGRGYSFEISQTSTITARPGGPKIEVPDPLDRYTSLGFADE